MTQITSDKHSAVEQLPTAKSLDELFTKYAGIALEKQINLSDVIDDNFEWQLYMDTQEISFGVDLVFPIQVLGTFSHQSKTWLWVWSNSQANVPQIAMKQALQLKQYGEQNGIDVFTTEQFVAEVNDAHKIGLIATGLFNNSCYYLADFGEGAVLVTINNQSIDDMTNDDATRVVNAFTQVISTFEVEHKAALENYLLAKGYLFNYQDNQLIANKDEQQISVEFDTQFRIIGLTAL